MGCMNSPTYSWHALCLLLTAAPTNSRKGTCPARTCRQHRPAQRGPRRWPHCLQTARGNLAALATAHPGWAQLDAAAQVLRSSCGHRSASAGLQTHPHQTVQKYQPKTKTHIRPLWTGTRITKALQGYCPYVASNHGARGQEVHFPAQSMLPPKLGQLIPGNSVVGERRLCRALASRKFLRRAAPCVVATLSGWNWTPQWGLLL